MRMLLSPPRALAVLLALCGTFFALPAQAATPLTLGQKAVVIAAKQVGKPYQFGATGPRAFDCSGLTSYVFTTAGRALPRTALQQYRAVRHIPLSLVRPGDLIFMAASGSSRDANRIDHVGVWAGGNSWYVARYRGTTVTRQILWTKNLWVGRP